MEYADGGILGAGGIGRFPPITHFRSRYRRANGVGNRPPFSAIMALKEGRLARRRLAAIPPGAEGNRGRPDPLNGALFSGGSGG